MSKDGIIKDHIDAAIITPEANPNNNFSSLGLILLLIKKTIADPNVVPIKGINNPIVNSIIFPPFLLYINCYSFPFKLVTISILFIFLDNSLDTTYDTTNVPTSPIIYDINFMCAPKS